MGLALEKHENEGQVLPRHLLVAKPQCPRMWGRIKQRTLLGFGLFPRSLLGVEDKQLKASGFGAVLVLDRVLQAQAGSLVRCCGSSYHCLWG